MSETGPQSQPDDALVDLLIKQVTEGLSPAEQRALDVLDSATASDYLRDFERAAAAITLAGTDLVEPSPALRTLIEQQAQAHFGRGGVMIGTAGEAAAAGATPVAGVGAPRAAIADNVVDFKTAGPSAAGTRSASRSGAWGWLAAAACLLLAIFGWLRSPPPNVAPPTAEVQVPIPPAIVKPAEIPAAPPTPAEERQALLARSESVKVTLGATKDPAAAGVTGDVVWDPATQKGYLHFVGLAPNDPQVHQYQIWIFDGQRDKRYPVDGGVFDVPADSSDVVIIPIRATLAIRTAAAFAVTVEKPGGVVVSGLAHVVALGKAG